VSLPASKGGRRNRKKGVRFGGAKHFRRARREQKSGTSSDAKKKNRSRSHARVREGGRRLLAQKEEETANESLRSQRAREELLSITKDDN